jgi:hypothetical protein
VTLSIANWNRNDNLLNTWSYVDSIQIVDALRSYVPVAQNGGAAGRAASEQVSEPVTPAAATLEAPGEAESIR